VKARTALERDFEARLAVWSSLAFRVAYSVLRQREDAEDVAQDVLTRAHRKLRQLRDPARLQEWIVRMAWRMAINKRASNIRRIAREEAPAEVVAPPSPEDVALSEQRSEQVWSAIDGLPEKLRIVVVLASIQGHDLAEVASALGIPEGTVKSRLFEARKQLRERLR
jgi:RNA polymerase sigma-70 factor (ECF subfamily)